MCYNHICTLFLTMKLHIIINVDVCRNCKIHNVHVHWSDIFVTYAVQCFLKIYLKFKTHTCDPTTMDDKADTAAVVCKPTITYYNPVDQVIEWLMRHALISLKRI